MTTTSETATVLDELIELRGLRFHYRDWPSTKPDAQAVVLQHGLAQHARYWDTTAKALCANYRVLALDLRGHGETAWGPAADYRPEVCADDLAAFVDALGLKRFALAGLSLGGSSAIAYAGRRPPELERLVIVDIAPEQDPEGMEGFRTLLARRDIFPDRERVITRVVENTPNADPSETRNTASHNLMRIEDGNWTWRWDRALRQPGAVDNLTLGAGGWAITAEIAVPTLFLRGEISNILPPEFATKLISVIPDARLVEIPGAGHDIPSERPTAFIEAVRSFLANS